MHHVYNRLYCVLLIWAMPSQKWPYSRQARYDTVYDNMETLSALLTWGESTGFRGIQLIKGQQCGAMMFPVMLA